MFTRKTLLAAAVVSCLGVAGPAMAQPGPGGWHHGPVLLDGVALTSDQETRLHALMKASHEDSRGLREQMHVIREKIDSTLLSSGEVTEATLAPLVQQQEALMQQLDAKHLSNEIAIRNLLTAGQLAQASSTHAQMASLHKQERALHKSEDAPTDPPD